jgi:hypothetical protein
MPLRVFDRAALDCLLLREQGLAKNIDDPAARVHADCAAVLERAIAALDAPLPSDDEIDAAREFVMQESREADGLAEYYTGPVHAGRAAAMRLAFRGLDALARERCTHHTTIRKSEHGWAVWVYDYKVCEHSEQDRARDCAEALEGAIFKARSCAGTMVLRGSFCPEIGRPNYQRVWLSEEALKLARERMKTLAECGAADAASVPGHPEHFVWLLARDLGHLPKEND